MTDERKAEEARRRAEQDAEALAARREAVAQAQAEALAERKRKQALQLREVEREEVRALVAAIIHGDAAIEDIDPALLRSPRALAALELAQHIRDLLTQHILSAALQDGVRHAALMVADPNLDPRVRLTALACIAKIKAGGLKRAQEAGRELRQMLERAGASREVLSSLSDEALEARARALLRGGDGEGEGQ